MIEKLISPLIASQFPAFYQDEGPLFIQFVTAYYAWLESNNVISKSRSLLINRDIDTTVDDFIIYFKEKYLKNIQFDVKTNKRLLVKHALDIHRSKGSERGIDLFFKLVYGENASVYYPGDDIFRLDNNEWITPRFLEISSYAKASSFIGKKIFGINSGASAYVENAMIKNSSAIQLYITNLNKDFYIMEGLYLTSISDSSPIILGSLGAVTISSNTGIFVKGEEVLISSATSSTPATAIVRTPDLSDLLITSTGTGFVHTQNVNIISNITTATAVGVAYLQAKGFDKSYFENKEGFLDNSKYFYDSDYYQEYSYDIISSLSFDKYASVLKKVMHVAGTKMFGSVNIEGTVSNGSALSSIVTATTVVIPSLNFSIITNSQYI